MTLNTQEQKRVLILNRIQSGQLSVGQAAPLLEVSERHVRRILAAYRKEGVAALAHGNRGRQPKQTIPPEVRRQVLSLAGTTYAGCTVSHLRDLLAEREQIALSRSSVRRILLEGGLIDGHRRKAPKHRRRRNRYRQEGMLIQIDGSRHAWLEDRGPQLSLLAAIDDATGKVVAAVFRQQEDAQGYFLLVQQLVEGSGRPLALYHDRHSTFAPTKPTSKTERVAVQLEGKDEQHLDTHFGRLLQDLEITSIAARSPQAKGRVERLFGTLQQRLVIELRLANVSCLQEANTFLAQYLPRFNAQFAVPAQQAGMAYRPLPEHLKLQELLCFKYERRVGADHVVRFGKLRIQIQPDQQRRSYAQARVEVHERVDGSVAIYYQGRCLKTTEAPLEAPVLRTRSGPRPAARSATAPQQEMPADPALPPTPRETREAPSASQSPGTLVSNPNSPWRQGPMLKRRT